MSFTQNSWMKKISFILLGILASCLILLMLIPTFLSTEWGQKEFTRLLNERIAGNVQIKKLNLNLFTGQSIEGFVLNNSKGDKILSFSSFTTDETLFNLILGWHKTPQIQLIGLEANLLADTDGLTNIHLALNPPSSSEALSKQAVRILLNDVNASIQYADLPKPISFQFTGKTKQGDMIGSFNVDASLAGFTFEELVKARNDHVKLMQLQEHANIKLTIRGSNIPVSLLDQLLSSEKPELAGILTKALGDKLDLKVEKIPNISGFGFHLDAKTPILMTNWIAQIEPTQLVLLEPASLVWKISPELFKHLNQVTQLTSLPFTLDQPTQIQGNIETLKLPLNFAQDQIFDFAKSTIKGYVNLSQTNLKGSSAFGNLDIQKMSVKIEADQNDPKAAIEVRSSANQNGQPFQLSLNTLVDKRFKWRYPSALQFELQGLPSILIEQFLGKNSSLSQALGTHLTATVNATPDKDNLKLEFNVASELHENLLSGQFAGYFVEDEIFQLSSPAFFNYSLTPTALRNLGIIKDSSYMTTSSTPIALTIQPTAISLSDTFLENIQLSGEIKLQELAVLEHPELGPTTIKHITLPWTVDAKNNRGLIKFLGETHLAEKSQQGSMEGEISIENWLENGQLNLHNANFVLKADVNKFPVAILEAVLNKPELEILLGDTLDIEIDGQLSMNQSYPGALKATFRGAQLHGSGSFAIDKLFTFRTVDSPTSIEFTLTPERFVALRKAIGGQSLSDDGLMLGHPASAILTINEFKLPFHSTPLFTEAALDAHLSIDKFVALEINQGNSMAFEKIETTIKSDILAKKISVDLRGIQKEEGNKLSQIQLKGFVENLFTPDQIVDIPNLALNLDTQFRHFPSSLFCRAICLNSSMREKIEALFGETLDLSIKTHLKKLIGPIELQMSGPNGNISVNAHLSQGILTLKKDFAADFGQTPKLAQSVLQDILPLASDLIAAQSPLQIRISASGFAVPLFPFDLSYVQIGSAMLDMGKVQFSTQGQVGEILSLLTPQGANQISMWFTPLYFSMHDGALNLQRTDMLIADAYPVASWGKIDFQKDKINMMIGLTGKALSYAFKLKGLDQNYMLQLPYKGQIGHASIDKRKATARISALVAQSQGGPQGLILGTVLHIASGGLTEDQPPAPTTNPLPWESGVTTAQEQQEPTSTRTDPIGEISEGAKSLLNSFFR